MLKPNRIISFGCFFLKARQSQAALPLPPFLSSGQHILNHFAQTKLCHLLWVPLLQMQTFSSCFGCFFAQGARRGWCNSPWSFRPWLWWGRCVWGSALFMLFLRGQFPPQNTFFRCPSHMLLPSLDARVWFGQNDAINGNELLCLRLRAACWICRAVGSIF